MPPNETELQTALEMFPIHILRKIIDERDIDFSSRKSDDLIEKLMEKDWTDDQFESLKSRLADIQKETNPFGRYIAGISAIDSSIDEDATNADRVETSLLTDEADFDDNNELVEEGFQIIEHSDEELEGVHWTKSVNYELSPLNEVKKESTVYQTGFNIDFGEDVLFVDCNLPAKARGLRTNLAAHGIQTENIGHENLPNEIANEHVQEFINTLEDKIEDEDPQDSLSDDNLLEIDLVEILLDESELKDIKIGGRTDIINNDEVKRFLEDHDSRIVRLEGRFWLLGDWFSFTTGYSDGMGSVSVEKKGKADENPEKVEDAFAFIFDSFYPHFVDV